MPVDPAKPVVTAACFFHCRWTMGEVFTRHSLRPLRFRKGQVICTTRARTRRGIASPCPPQGVNHGRMVRQGRPSGANRPCVGLLKAAVLYVSRRHLCVLHMQLPSKTDPSLTKRNFPAGRKRWSVHVVLF